MVQIGFRLSQKLNQNWKLEILPIVKHIFVSRAHFSI